MAFFLLQFVVRYIFFMDFCYHICTYRKLVLSLHRVIKNTVMGSIVKFTKMHGAGNDYIYVNTLLYNIVDPAKAAQVWSLPHYAIGSDGLILIGEAKSAEADFSMRIFNNDGSEAKMCGNGARCVARYLHDKHLTDKTDIRLETLSGIKVLHLNIADGIVKDVTVDMGEPADMKPLPSLSRRLQHRVRGSDGRRHAPNACLGTRQRHHHGLRHRSLRHRRGCLPGRQNGTGK